MIISTTDQSVRILDASMNKRTTALWLRLLSIMVVLGFGVVADAGTPPFAKVLSEDDLRSRGNQEASVVLIEYSDFTCGYCRKFFQETLPKLLSKYIESGKVKFLYRDYPRDEGGPGVDAAIAARCAGEQKQYWAMHDRILGGSAGLDDEVFRQHANSLGLDLRQFSSCLQQDKHREAVLEDKQDGLDFGFRGTPGFVLVRTVNGKVDVDKYPPVGIPGAFPYDVFEEQIELLLREP